MKGLDNLIRLHRWQLNEKRRHLVELERLTQRLAAQIRELEVEIRNEQQVAGSSTEAAITYGDYARAAIGRMLDLVESLPVKYREALLLRAVRGLSQHQIAEALGLGIKTVETRLFRARRMLRASCQTDPQCSADTARPSCPGRLND